MVTIYVKLYNPAKNEAALLAAGLAGLPGEVEYLKSSRPDDGEIISHQGRYAIRCADGDWQEAVETLKQGGESLVYSVVKKGEGGELAIVEAGELNSEVRHYSTRSKSGKQIYAFWFEDCLPMRSAA